MYGSLNFFRVKTVEPDPSIRIKMPETLHVNAHDMQADGVNRGYAHRSFNPFFIARDLVPYPIKAFN